MRRVQVALLHLELGNPVAQQPTDAIGALEHDGVVAGARQLLSGRKPGRTGTDHDDAFAGLDAR